MEKILSIFGIIGILFAIIGFLDFIVNFGFIQLITIIGLILFLVTSILLTYKGYKPYLRTLILIFGPVGIILSTVSLVTFPETDTVIVSKIMYIFYIFNFIIFLLVSYLLFHSSQQKEYAS